MSNIPEDDEASVRSSRSGAYDVESLLATNASTSHSATACATSTFNNFIPNIVQPTGLSPHIDTSSKLTAKVVPFASRETYDALETAVSQPASNDVQKPLPNPMLPPLLPYPVASPLALANLQWYSLWSNMLNWPLYSVPNPAFMHQPRPLPAQTQAQSTPTSESNVTQVRSEENCPSNDSSLNSNSATESLFAASECHRAVLQDEDGDTPLHIAIVQENQKLVQKLIGLITFSRLTVDTPNNLRQTPLHLAVLTNQPLVVKKLINSGADANIRDRHGQTALHIAAEKGYLECLAQILIGTKNNPNNTKPADIEMRNFDGYTLLHVAVQKQHNRIIEELIKHGANINAKDGKGGHTPLHHAIDYESCDAMHILLANGANANKANYSGVTPLHSANASRSKAVSRILVAQDVASSTSRLKIATTSGTPSIESNRIKNTDVKTEAMKRPTQSSSPSSKRLRVNDNN